MRRSMPPADHTGLWQRLALPVWMHIQPVQIAVPADIAKADDLILLLSHQRIVAEERAVPCSQVGMPVRPGIQLLGV